MPSHSAELKWATATARAFTDNTAMGDHGHRCRDFYFQPDAALRDSIAEDSSGTVPLRASDTGFCFTGGCLLASSMLLLSAWIKVLPGMGLRLAITILSSAIVLGLMVLAFMPKTKDKPVQG